MTNSALTPSNISAVAVSALDPSPRVLLPSAGPSDTRTQGGRRSSAERPRTRERGQKISGGHRSARARAEEARPASPTEDAVARSKAERPSEISGGIEREGVKPRHCYVPAAVSSARGRGERAQELFGGRRGLIELSSGLCRNPRAAVKMDGQNGKTYDTNPVVKTSCPKKKGKKKKQHKHRKRGRR